MTHEPLLHNALSIAADLGAAEAELVLTHEVGVEIEVARGTLETLIRTEAIGLGTRLFTRDRRVGVAYTTALDDDSVRRLIQSAWQNACVNEPDDHNVLPDATGVSDDDWSEQDFAAIPVRNKIDFCRALESKTLAAEARVTHVQQASYGDVRTTCTVANSHGLLRTFRNEYGACSVVAAAAQAGSDSEMGWEFDQAPRFEDLRLDWVAVQCAFRATRALGGAPCATGVMAVVLDNCVASQFLQVIGPALMANNVLKGKSLFVGRVGEAIASETVTIIDQNDLAVGMNRAPYDAEGVSAQRTVLVDRGRLLGFLHNAYTAHKMGVSSTANAARGGGFRSAPEVGPTNAFVQPGDRTCEELVQEAGAGILVTQAMGVHTADPISGDFSFGIAGQAIENGRIGRPVRGVTLAGNIKDVLRNTRAVGNDLRFFGAYGAPSLLIADLVVGGA